jgi:hypothetical protein
MENVEKRRQPRMQLTGYTANIACDGFVFSATVQDVSMKGIQLQGLPARFTAIKGEKFSVVISDYQEVMHYKLTVHSRWRKKDGRLVAVGFHVASAPVSWKQLISEQLPVQKQDDADDGAWDQYVGARV